MRARRIVGYGFLALVLGSCAGDDTGSALTYGGPDDETGAGDGDGDPTGDGDTGDGDGDATGDGDSTGDDPCGNGVLEGAEQCDDGNDIDTDDCVSCELAYCGDGAVRAGVEECDDGNDDPSDECLPVFCTIAVCGDGEVKAGDEECDDANDVDQDECLNSCTAATCGDGVVWAGQEECDDGDPGGDGCDEACVAEISPQCELPYAELDDSTRHRDYGGGDACDANMDGSWYRFTGASGTKMPTMSPGLEKCGTINSGWLSDGLPVVADQVIEKTVCFPGKEDSCEFSTQIDVVNCGDFYLWRLFAVPQCPSRYCSDD